MAGASLLSLLDDIASLLDDVSVLTKVATKKTAGVLGDDLALNAEQVTGVDPKRELPVVWAVAKGSSLNKLILVPSALGLSVFLPSAVNPLLMCGGAFLCFEGFEKVFHKLFHPAAERAEQAAHQEAARAPAADLVSLERDKIRGAIRTDFVLSAEIIVISLGTMETQPLQLQALTLSAVAILMTVGVYGLVAGIVKLDDAGLALIRSTSDTLRSVGNGILVTAPYLLKSLGVLGTIAMFLVGGGILSHGVPALHHLTQALDHTPLAWLTSSLLHASVGMGAGALLLAAWTLGRRAWRGAPGSSARS